MSLASGTTLGPYEIVALIGAGGMGEVYRAVDTRLHRVVAIKILSGASSADSRSRFLQEARAASALNHPNIVQVYDVGDAGDTSFIVMELVDGGTFQEAIGHKGLDAAVALDYAIQIADALAAAHAAGVVHRDVKPGNIRISRGRVVKVLDFGLAKVAERAAAADDATRTMDPKTVEGTLLGTLAYMSPEQAEGKVIDRRSDVFAFGTVLYEMVTGKRIFQRDSTAATLSAILREDPPPMSRTAPATPRELEQIVTRCIRKDPAARYQSMDEVADALRAVRAGRREWRNRRGLVWVLPVAAGVAALLWLWPRDTSLRATDLARLTSDVGLTTDPALSRDGKLLAYASDRGGSLNIWVQPVAGGEQIQVTKDTVDNSEPSFSPDSTRIAFRSQREGGSLYVVPAFGGTASRIAAGGRRPRFSPDGEWIAYWVGEAGVFSRNQIYVVSRNGGEPRRLAAGLFSASSPIWSPDGKYLLFLGAASDRQPMTGQYDWWVAPLDGGPPRATGVLAQLARNGVFPFANQPSDWVGDAILFTGSTLAFAARTTAGMTNQLSIWRQRLTPNPWSARGKPERITSGAGIEIEPSIAGDRLALAAMTEGMEIWMLPLNPRTGRAGGEIELVTSPGGSKTYPAVSHDGSRLVFIADRQNRLDPFGKDLRSGTVSPLAVSESAAVAPVPSADGLRVLYYEWLGDRKPAFTFWEVNTQGGPPRQVCGDCDGPLYCWSNDEKKVIYFKTQAGGPGELVTHDLESGAEAVFAADPKYAVRLPRLSSDERWVAFQTVVSQTERRLYVAAVHDWHVGPEEEWIYVADARAPAAWSTSGDVLYFLSDQDGFRCIWAQRLDRASRRPQGRPFAVQHLHTARRSLMVNTEVAAIGLSQGSDKLFFSMPEHTGNIWVGRLEKQR